jgi:hypothetical protein
MPVGLICGVDIDKMVESVAGKSLLLTDTKPLGICILPKIHQMGTIKYADLKLDAEGNRELCVPVEISKELRSPFISLVLHEVRYSGSVLRCEVCVDTDADSGAGAVERAGGCLPLDIGVSKRIHIRLAISENADSKDVSGFLVFVFQGEEKGPTILFKRLSTLITGTFLSARVFTPKVPLHLAVRERGADKGDHRSAMSLSSEAPVFVSRRDKEFFDLPGFLVSDLFYDIFALEQAFGIVPTSPLGEIVARVFACVRTHGASFASPPEVRGVSLREKYVQCLEEHLRFGSAGNAFAAISEYNGVKERHIKKGKNVLPFKLLSFSFMLEEMQMHLDTQNYDYHYVEVTVPNYEEDQKKTHDHRSSQVDDDNYAGGAEYMSSVGTGSGGLKRVMGRHDGRLIIEFTAPGSAESRPSVQIGNIVRFRPVQEHWGMFKQYYYEHPSGQMVHNFMDQYPIPELRGVVVNYVLKTERVTLQLSEPASGEQRRPSRDLLAATRFHVRFELDRTAFFFAQEALSFICSGAQHAQNLREILQPIYTPILKDWPNGAGYACKAAVLPILATLNGEQSEAVRSICAMQLASVGMKHLLPPFCLYGPPGTGKTTTVVRAIEALFAQSPKMSILACAPSDAAADVLCIKLHELFKVSASQKSVKIVRMNWWKRVRSSVPIQILQYCCLFNDIFQMPENGMLAAEQIVVVCTCGAAGMLGQRKVFDYVFIDEASQASEAESLAACCLADPHKGVIVLAGDPKQLGPGCRSPANAHMLSLLERLLSSTAYGNFSHPNQVLPNPGEPGSQPYDDRMVLGTYLVRNYRSHRDIIALPSELFYRSSLRPCGDDKETHAVIGKQWLRTLRAGPATGAVSAAVEAVRRSALGQGARAGTSEEAPAIAARSTAGSTGSITEETIKTQSSAIFVSVTGKHSHEQGSPSFYNDDEIFEIKDLISSLIACADIVPRATTKDFCVICAFRQQTLRTRTFLREHGLGNVDVGAVEDYQGQERRFTIITTVLSSRPRMLSGISESYGLLSHARRFNVAITRAKALCIVVGNPNLLLGDPYWRAYIEACDDREAYYGQVCQLLRRRQKELQKDFVKSGGVDTVISKLLLTAGMGPESTVTPESEIDKVVGKEHGNDKGALLGSKGGKAASSSRRGLSADAIAPRPPGLSINDDDMTSAAAAAAAVAAEDAAMEDNFFRINYDSEWRAML